MCAIGDRIEQLDTSLYQHVLNQTTEEDRRSLLALQAAVRKQVLNYVYLEVGSYKGGSLQPHLVDPHCSRIFSIDPRVADAPDSRGVEHYPVNTTAGMLASLSRIPGANTEKITPFDTTCERLDSGAIVPRPHLCFVDGEHTDAAVLSDARFCLSVMDPNGVIAFHDANLIFTGLQRFLAELSASQCSFHAHVLPDSVFLVELGTARYCQQAPLCACIADNYKAYLAGMSANDWYRYAYNMPVYRFLRRIRRLFPKRKIPAADAK